MPSRYPPTLSVLCCRISHIPGYPSCLNSFSTVLHQVVFSLPLALLATTLCRHAVILTLSLLTTCPDQFHLLRRTSQLMPLICAISLTHSLVCYPLLLSDSQYPSQALVLEGIQLSLISLCSCLCDLPRFTAI